MSCDACELRLAVVLMAAAVSLLIIRGARRWPDDRGLLLYLCSIGAFCCIVGAMAVCEAVSPL